MKKTIRTVLLVLFLGIGIRPLLAQKPSTPQKLPPLKALLVTGGCCHDYERQKLILTKGISARAEVEWTVVHQGGKSTNAKIPLYEDENWADGFDIVIHNECFAKVPDVDWVKRILKPHKEGTPAVLIHCAMHCYRTGTNDWFDFVGVQSPGHGPHYAFEVKNKKSDHFIMKDFGEEWTTPNGELYHSLKVFDTATPLATALRRQDNQPQTCVWTNQYGKTRVFATTIGHYNETMAHPQYLDMVTRGILWACKREDEKFFRKTDDKTNAEILALAKADVAGGKTAPALKCCGEGNLAFGGVTKASSEEKSKKNFARNAVDGDLSTRWCAAGAGKGQWWQVDLGKPEAVKNIRIHWEGNAAYQYEVAASPDGETWTTIVDQKDNKRKQRIAPHEVDAKDARYLRLTYLGSSTGGWGSIWEFEASTGELQPLPKGVSDASPGGKGGSVAGVSDVQAPAGFEVRMFGKPPEVNYPVCLTAALNGDVYVGVDDQGSLGKTANRGKILRCRDIDGDGQADEIIKFADVDHPRGLVYDNGSLWVLHPPTLTVFHDDNRDGIADRKDTLITGISTDQVNQRGADHTTNGIRMGIDGWIYIAVGDFGFTEAKGADGRVLSKRGGGIVRVRPDGSDMEIYCWGLRNILDVCLRPDMHGFTRDNTNDGGGWNVRFSHILQSAEYGYPSRYLNFSEEIMPTLADYGGGSGCGGMYLHDLRWPDTFNNASYTCDWGRSIVYRHTPDDAGPTFAPHQEEFVKIPRPTDIDVDGSGRMYVSSWKNGKFAYSGPDVGFVAQILPQDFLPKPAPDMNTATEEELVGHLASPSAVHRLHASREIIRRGQDLHRTKLLNELTNDKKSPRYARIAAMFTLKQLDGVQSHPQLLQLLADNDLRETALRVLTDRKDEVASLESWPFTQALKDESPRVRAQAVISLGRLGQKDAAKDLLPLTQRESQYERPTADPLHAQPDPGRVIPHLAVRALIALNAVDECLAAVNGPYRAGALAALQEMHTPATVDGLVTILGKTAKPAKRIELLTTLIRLYHREGDYKSGWWGTRPDRTGPYFDRQPWAASERIGNVVRNAIRDADADTAKSLIAQLSKHVVKLNGLPKLAGTDTKMPAETAIVIPKADPNDPKIIANIPYEKVFEIALNTPGNAERGGELFRKQSCTACHTYAEGQSPKGPHLVDIGKRYKRSELIESILKPSAKLAQGFESWQFLTSEGLVHDGFVVSESATTISLRKANGLGVEIPLADIELRKKQEKSVMPEGMVNNLQPKDLADLLAWLESLRK